VLIAGIRVGSIQGKND